MKTQATPRPVLCLNHHSNPLSHWPTSSTRREQQPQLYSSSKGDVVVEIIDFKHVDELTYFTSEPRKTRPRRIFHLFSLIQQQSLVTMSSQNEGRISLALQAYNSNQVLSLRTTASTYDVLLITLRKRRTSILPRAIAPANSRKFTLEEEQIIL
jgi:ribosomal protein S18